VTSPVLALRAAILARMSGDADLAALMGGAVRVYDEPPRAAEPVYALFGETSARDASSDGVRAHEHAVALVVYGKRGSARTAIEVAERLDAILDDAPLEPVGHRLVHLRTIALEVARDPPTGLARATLRLRALTEVI
jgi:hypothetical protein